MIRYLLEKEFKQFRRNTFMPRLAVIFPLVVLLIFPLVANFDVKNINLSILDNDKSSYSQELIQKVQSSGYFRITQVSGHYNESLLDVEMDNSDVILEIPHNFEKSVMVDKAGSLMISANAVNGNKGGLGSAYLMTIINDFNNAIRADLLNSGSRFRAPQFEIISIYRYNAALLYEFYMVPALIAMVITMISSFLPAMSIVLEKQNGTIEQMNVTPVTRFKFILSKLIPYWVVGYVAITIDLLVADYVWGLQMQGALVTFYLFITVYVLAMSGFGLVISNYASTVQQAMLMTFFFVLTFIFISGLYTPIANMPAWAQNLSYISPLRYIMHVMRMIFLKGSSIFELVPQFVALLGIAFIFITWAVLSYRKTA